MLSTRLHLLQADLHVHRCWLAAFRRRSHVASYSNATSRRPLRPRHGSEDQKKHRDLTADFTKQSQGHASQKLRITKHAKANRPGLETPKANPIIEDIRKAVAEVNIKHITDDYKALNERDKGCLNKRDVREIAQCLHYTVRKEKHNAANQHRQSGVRELAEFAETVVKDVKSGILVPSGKAYLHLIGIFKESGMRDPGIRFWKWLREQDETYVDVDCYGAAIELLAVEGMPLAELEELYLEALGRFPGNFAAYHLSPDAVLPDRERPFAVGGIPLTLLQGIMAARLLSGDTRNAYLALDTALRMYPEQVPQRFFWLFLEERPLQEAYAVFALACRGGNEISGAYYRSMLGALRSSSNLSSPTEHALAVRAMLSVTHMFIGTGGRVADNSVNEIAISATRLLRVNGIEMLAPEDKGKIVEAVMELIRGIFDMFALHGAKPGIPTFNSIITNLGGFGQSKQTIGIALRNADDFGLAPTDITWRSILSVAGMFRDRGLVEKTWCHLRDSRIESQQSPKASDFHALVKPAHLSGAIGFALDELDKFRDVLDSDSYEVIATRMEDPDEANMHSATDVEPVDVNTMLHEIGKMRADIEVIKERTKGLPHVQDFSDQELLMTLQPLKSSLILPDNELRQIYDELTSTIFLEIPSAIDSCISPSPPSAQPTPASITKSKTNIPLSTLRYGNWKMLNFILEMSEKHDRLYMQKVNEAIAAGTIPPKRTKGLALGDDEVVSQGLSSAGKADRGDANIDHNVDFDEERVAEVRREILRLRGRM